MLSGSVVSFPASSRFVVYGYLNTKILLRIVVGGLVFENRMGEFITFL